MGEIMYYRLKAGYVLRGWEKKAWVLVQRPGNNVKALEQAQFQALTLCDGETQLPGGLLDQTLEKALQQCEADGWIVPCSEPHPLDADQYYQYYHNRYVQSVFWSVTGRCNFRCRHCYMDAPDGQLGELSTQQALDLIDQMADCGVLRVDLTGGEPFVRRDIWQLIDRILFHHMTISMVYTNGWLVNDELLDEFEKRGIKPEFSISFDGVGWHDWMRGVPGAEEAALRALQLLHKRGFATNVEMCIHRGNVDILPQSIEVLRAAGVQTVKVSNVAMTPLWCQNSQGNALTNAEYIEAMLPYITWYYKMGCPLEHLVLSNVVVMNRNFPYRVVAWYYDDGADCSERYLCGAARMNCYITPEGRLLPCMPMTASPLQDQFPLVQDIGLQKGLSSSYFMKFVNGKVKDLFAVNPECRDCEHRCQCGGGCRANALLEGDKNLMGCDRTMCLLWKNGYAERIRKTVEDAVHTYGGVSPKA